jgi:hypothetical protein
MEKPCCCYWLETGRIFPLIDNRTAAGQAIMTGYENEVSVEANASFIGVKRSGCN